MTSPQLNDVETRILDLAKRRFERFGFPKTTIDEIARDGRVSTKTIYRCFRSKEDLFARVVMRELLAARREILRGLDEVEDPLERLKALMIRALDYFRVERFVLKVLDDQDGMFVPFLRSDYAAVVEEEVIGLIAGILREGMEKGRIRKLDERMVAYIMLKLYQAFTYARTPALPRPDGDARRERAELIGFLERAISKDP